jgi:hypothetical protein
MKKFAWIAVVAGLVATFGSLTASENRTIAATAPSRAAVVGEATRLAADLERAEERLATAGPAGVKIYSPGATGQLLGKYQALAAKLAYLQGGVAEAAAPGWGGYTFSGPGGSYDPSEVARAVREIAPALPGQFLRGLHIFLLPEVIPEVSGLGGPGYTVLGGQADPENLSGESLRVTLYHELGHSVHMSYMDRNRPSGLRRWDSYLRLRGGVWHGPGAVNTAGWSASSEETFAEDFRMLFGKDQPFYGDIRLGDPRRDPAQAAAVKRFMQGLAASAPQIGYQSPWLPKELAFWQFQPWLIAGLWAMLAAGLLALRPEPARLETERALSNLTES